MICFYTHNPVSHIYPTNNYLPPARVPYQLFASRVLQQQPRFGERLITYKDFVWHTLSAYGGMKRCGFSNKPIEDLLQMNFDVPGGKWREGRPVPARYEGPHNALFHVSYHEKAGRMQRVEVPAYNYCGSVPRWVLECAAEF